MSDSFQSGEHHPVDPGHEPDEVSIGGIVRVGVLLASIVVVSMIGMVALRRGLHDLGESDLPDWATAPLREGPAGTRLNPDQSGELRRLRAEHRRVLSSYAWIDEEAGVARVPIDRAMEMLADEQLPARSPSRD